MLTTLVFVVAYVSITGMIGWPSVDSLPRRFSLLSTRIVEPDKIRNLPGHVYLWVELIDEHQVVISAPRALEVPYSVELAKRTDDAQKMLDTGQAVQGKISSNSQQTPDQQGTPKAGTGPTGKSTGVGQHEGTAQLGSGVEKIGDAAALSFSDMPPVDLPNKDISDTGQVVIPPE